jgi:hypothetical protein
VVSDNEDVMHGGRDLVPAEMSYLETTIQTLRLCIDGLRNTTPTQEENSTTAPPQSDAKDRNTIDLGLLESALASVRRRFWRTSQLHSTQAGTDNDEIETTFKDFLGLMNPGGIDRSMEAGGMFTVLSTVRYAR